MFFRKVLTLFEDMMNYDTHVLRKCGIVPSKDHSYMVSSVIIIIMLMAISIAFASDYSSISLSMHVFSWMTLFQPSLTHGMFIPS